VWEELRKTVLYVGAPSTKSHRICFSRPASHGFMSARPEHQRHLRREHDLSLLRPRGAWKNQVKLIRRSVRAGLGQLTGRCSTRPAAQEVMQSAETVQALSQDSHQGGGRRVGPLEVRGGTRRAVQRALTSDWRVLPVTRSRCSGLWEIFSR